MAEIRAFPVEHSTHEIEELRPLVRKVDDAEPFPINALGTLSAAAKAIEAHTRAPIEICSQAVLGAAALVGQAHADVVLPTGQSRPTSLFLMTNAGTGERKTAADRLALRPVYEREEQLRDAHRTDLAEYEIKSACWKAERDQANGELKKSKRKTGDKKFDREADLRALGPEPQPPLTPILVCPEPTFEGYFRLTASGHPALGLFSAEGGSFIAGYGMSADQKLKTAASISSVWDGEPIKRVRAGDGSQVLAGRRLSLHLMAQPEVADLMLHDDLLINQGLLSRVLVVAPASTAGTRLFAEPPDAARQQLQQYDAKLAAMLRAPLPLREGTRNELRPRRLILSDEARRMWIDLHNFVEENLGPDGELAPIPGLANKAPEHAARIAALMTLFRDLNATSIGIVEMANATILIRYYLTECLRLKAGAHINRDLVLAQRVWAWIKTKCSEPAIYPAAVYNACTIREIRDRSNALRIIRILEEHGYLSRVSERVKIAGSWRSEVWQIHGRKLS
jgi:hypothetical protein